MSNPAEAPSFDPGVPAPISQLGWGARPGGEPRPACPIHWRFGRPRVSQWKERVPQGAGRAGRGEWDQPRLGSRRDAARGIRRRFRAAQPAAEQTWETPDQGQGRPSLGRRVGRRGLQARVLGGVLSKKQLAGKPVLQQVCWILGDTHSGCRSLPSSSSCSASEGVQVPRRAGQAVNVGKDCLPAAASLGLGASTPGAGGTEVWEPGLPGLREEGFGD